MAQEQFQAPVRTTVNLRNLALFAGALIVAPYIIRRLLALSERGLGSITANDVVLAGKDGVRDVADDMNVGGLGGFVKRTGGRIADHLRTDV